MGEGEGTDVCDSKILFFVLTYLRTGILIIILYFAFHGFLKAEGKRGRQEAGREYPYSLSASSRL